MSGVLVAMSRIVSLALGAMLFMGCDRKDPDPERLMLLQAFVGNVELDVSGITDNVPVDRTITLTFSGKTDERSAAHAISLRLDDRDVEVTIALLSDGRTVRLTPVNPLLPDALYSIRIIGDVLSGGVPFVSSEVRFRTAKAGLTIIDLTVGSVPVEQNDTVTGVPLDLALTMRFSVPVGRESLGEAIRLEGPGTPALSFEYSDEDRQVIVTTLAPLAHLSKYTFRILNTLKGNSGETFPGLEKTFYTEVDETPKFPVITDEALLTLVQERTFAYFWDFAHPVSGMARERNTSGDIVTTGGSGFGIMALIVGVERGFISRDACLQRMEKVLTFLEHADRFHGAWPHWMDGGTGDVIPFSGNDNGGDLVETSFLIQGLLTFRQYLNAEVASEKAMVDRINALWESVEWDWYTRDGQDVLYWHWSPDKQWIMNLPIRGYNEALITYLLAAGSPTYPIEAAAYHRGWAVDGDIRNGQTFYGIPLPLGPDYGGPMFFAHYSFLGLDPRGLSDTYADYWIQNVNHARINHAYAVDNPKHYVGYSDENWGLTASDNQQGYAAHSPTNDLGVITPTAALSSIPYTPDESMRALRFFYYTLGDRLWGPYGFYDAFNITAGWTAESYLSIDQGPIIVMIENHRTGLLWDLFMSAPEVSIAMERLGFFR